MNQEDIIDRIRKLLRLGKSTNEHEAQLALEHALRLAARYKVDVEAISLDPDIEKIVHERFKGGQRLSHVTKLAMNVCVGYFNVSVVLSRGEFVFIGTASDMAIAHYVLGFVSGACNRCLKGFIKSARRKPSLNQRRNFVTGFFWGVQSRLRAAKQTQFLEDSKLALIIADGDQKREAYKQQLFPKLSIIPLPKMRRNPTAISQGFTEGRNTTISPALNRSAQLLLT